MITARISSITLLCLLTLALFALPATAQAPAPAANDEPLRIIAFGAHPDDCEIKVGGTAAKWAALGHKVKFVAVTNGDIGHPEMAGGPLARRRAAEVADAAKVLGIEVQVLDHHDGELMPTLEIRKQLIRLIREWKADIVITHRPNDYHPDHRYTSILVQDGAYMVAVPFICPDVPPLDEHPVYLYMSDNFQKPYPFEPDIAVDITDVMDTKVEALSRMPSQFLEWLPWMSKQLDQVPKDPAQAKEWLSNNLKSGRFANIEPFRESLAQRYGADNVQNIKFAEAFEISEYSRQPTAEEIRRLFPF
jgi:LmbE family N-acetylglucosaminyl deacetylase